MKLEKQIGGGIAPTYAKATSVAGATHYQLRGTRTPYEITAVHSATERKLGAAPVYHVAHGGMRRSLDEVDLLVAVLLPSAPTFQLTLSEDEARVLSEILRHTRKQGEAPELKAVVSSLYLALPRGSDFYRVVEVGGLLSVQKGGALA